MPSTLTVRLLAPDRGFRYEDPPNRRAMFSTRAPMLCRVRPTRAVAFPL